MIPAQRFPLLRAPLLGLGLAALLAGLWAGLLRLGWPWPLLRPTLPSAHGPLMVSGFLGTLIGLEQAVASARRWTYGAPLLTAGGAMAFIVGGPAWLGPCLMTLGSFAFAANLGLVLHRQPALHSVIMGLGALAWLVGNGLWLTGWPIYRVVMWWVGFLVLVITGERLELAQDLGPTLHLKAACLSAIGLLWCGLLIGLGHFDLGVRLTGVALLVLAGWLWRYDMAHIAKPQNEVERFTAICMFAAYIWLTASGPLALWTGGEMVGPAYDAWLHTLFLGFVISMLFGHAPSVFPAVLHKSLAFSQRFYVHLALLHLSLLLRICGDLAGWWQGRQWGGLLNAATFVIFLVNTGYAICTARNTESMR